MGPFSTKVDPGNTFRCLGSDLRRASQILDRIMKFVWVLLLLLAAFVWPSTSIGPYAPHIHWSPQARQQVINWANGGAKPWTHNVARHVGLPGHPRF